MAVFEIWAEGYAVDGAVGCQALLLGYGQGLNFVEACRDLERNASWFAGLYDASKNTFFARNLFDNEAAARASYG